MTKTSTSDRPARKNKAAALVKKIREFIAQQKNNTYNYRQVAHAIGANTPVQQRNVAMELVEMAFNGEDIFESKFFVKKTRFGVYG